MKKEKQAAGSRESLPKKQKQMDSGREILSKGKKQADSSRDSLPKGHMNYLSHNIAINLQAIRKAKGMSLDIVAEQTGVSKSMLAMIERGDANPSIGVLGKIMSGLRVSLEDLTKSPGDDAFMVDTDALEPTKDVPDQYRVWTCFPISDNRVMEIYRIEIAPHGVYESGSHGEHTREYISIQEGVLTLEESHRKWTVHANEVLRFASDRPHVYSNETDAPVTFMSFFLAV